jgi:hypothetical protein
MHSLQLGLLLIGCKKADIATISVSTGAEACSTRDAPPHYKIILVVLVLSLCGACITL